MKNQDFLILNVDDTEASRYAKTKILERAGYRVAEAGSGGEALDSARSLIPDLILLDVKLPDINGLEICRLLKSEASTSDVLILQTSAALITQSDRVKGLEGGADGYLAFPVSSEELIANVKALLRLQEARIQLAESEKRFRQLAENIDDIFWIFSTEDRSLLYVSSAYEKIWEGYPKKTKVFDSSGKSLIERAAQWLDSVDDLDRQTVETAFDKSFDTFNYDIQYKLREQGGEQRWVRDRAFAAKDELGNRYRLVRIASDITAQKNAEQALLLADEQKDQFLATLAHELRNPLGPIRHAVEVLKRFPESNMAQPDRICSVISRQVDNMTKLIGDLLDVARISKGKIQLNQKYEYLIDIIDLAVEISQPFIDERLQHLRYDKPSKDVVVYVDEVRIAQAISNLLNNAAKYMEKGGEIMLSVHTAQQKIEIVVQDMGIGISPIQMSAIFDIFSQGDTAPDLAQSGLGIGLSLVKKLVNLHGGDVSAKSEGRGRGSTFIISLPVVKASSIVPAQIFEDHNQTFPMYLNDGNNRVVIIDDNQDASETLSILLRQFGYDTVVGGDKASALSLVASHKPAVVILDIGLPGANGNLIAQQLRSEVALNKMSLIAMTGYGAENDRKSAMEAGFDYFLVKPAKIESIRQVFNAISSKHS